MKNYQNVTIVICKKLLIENVYYKIISFIHVLVRKGFYSRDFKQCFRVIFVRNGKHSMRTEIKFFIYTNISKRQIYLIDTKFKTVEKLIKY